MATSVSFESPEEYLHWFKQLVAALTDAGREEQLRALCDELNEMDQDDTILVSTFYVMAILSYSLIAAFLRAGPCSF